MSLRGITPLVVGWEAETLRYATAIFQQENKNEQRTHHDALEFPDGHCSPDTTVYRSGGNGTPAQPMTAADAEAQKRLAPVG